MKAMSNLAKPIGGVAGLASATPPALELEQVDMSYPGTKIRGEGRLQVLDQVSLQVKQGRFVSIIGPSGSGKSTLFHLIGGLLRPDGGHIRMNGQEVAGLLGHVSYMPQQPALFPWRTVEQNVMLAQEISGRPKKEARAAARQWLAKIGLSGYERAYPHELSGGMQQRVAFLRALMSPHELMLLDEPFSALDALTRSAMQRWLTGLWEQHRRSVLFITHSIEEALLLSDTIYVFSSRPARVLREVDVPFPRPRHESLAGEEAFLRLKQELSGLLQEAQQQGTGGRE
ncbi:ABC transporter ATP-binding protein [Paenibacillus popilliae]|uniref:ATPase component n=1 Tax=Paenibacillus popilliae ATCC 14706 TaxID=1212764 RepID=M9LLM5_PAEPP|nr:ABC transporter ATP-binding protein [Paenibacillus popilliae]GAC44215.1 ATPase component [Paenibacillus popilliae ATCC 14706]